MRELHCIGFDDHEVIAAVLAHRHLEFPGPASADTTISCRADGDGRATAFLKIVRRGDAGEETAPEEILTIDPLELTVALVNYCMARAVPIKKLSDKWVGLVGSGLSLFVAVHPSERAERTVRTPPRAG